MCVCVGHSLVGAERGGCVCVCVCVSVSQYVVGSPRSDQNKEEDATEARPPPPQPLPPPPPSGSSTRGAPNTPAAKDNSKGYISLDML